MIQAHLDIVLVTPPGKTCICEVGRPLRGSVQQTQDAVDALDVRAAAGAVKNVETDLVLPKDCVERDIGRVRQPAGRGVSEEPLELLPGLVGEELHRLVNECRINE